MFDHPSNGGLISVGQPEPSGLRELASGLPRSNEKMTPYSKQLLDPRWQRKRLEMLSAANWECERCFNADNTLHVHHKRYVKGRMPWEYSNAELQVLCSDCHKEGHDLKDTAVDVLNESISPSFLVGILGGYAMGHQQLSAKTEASVLEHGCGSGRLLGVIVSIMGVMAERQMIEVCRLIKSMDGPIARTDVQERALDLYANSEQAV